MSIASSPTTAFLFPGQGAQVVGMGAGLYHASTLARSVFEEADATLDFPLTKRIFEGPVEELRQTVNAQPAILCVSIACLRAMEEQLGDAMPTPAFVAGHSLGEYTALVAAQALTFADGLRLVRRRGELMQAASDRAPSGMAAMLGASLATVQDVCAATGTQVANLNSPGQYVIAGPLAALDEAVGLAQAQGVRRVVRLEVSGAFHTEMMRPAQDELDGTLRDVELHHTAVPVVANTTARPVTTPEEVRYELAQQLCGCVMWQASVEYMVAQGVTRFVEVGPGNVLTGLTRRIAPEVEAVAVEGLDAIAALAIS